MRLLAIDTALAACSAAVLDTEHAPATLASESLALLRGHAEALMPLIERVMKRAGLRFADLDRIAVTTGPGSFTGLRVGIAAARGLALAAAKPVVGITTFASFAAPFIALKDAVPVAVAIDARHNRVYFQVFGAASRILVSPRLSPLREALRAVTSDAPRLTGNAAALLAANWPAGARPPSAVERRDAPDIDWVARLGAVAIETGTPVKPFYMRAPDARPQDASRLARR